VSSLIFFSFFFLCVCVPSCVRAKVVEEEDMRNKKGRRETKRKTNMRNN